MSKAFKCEGCGKFQAGRGVARFRMSAPKDLLDEDALEDYSISDFCDACLDELVPQIHVEWWRDE